MPTMPTIQMPSLPDLSGAVLVGILAAVVALLMFWAYCQGRWFVQDRLLDYLSSAERELINGYRRRTLQREMRYLTQRVQRDAERVAAAAWRAYGGTEDGANEHEHEHEHESGNEGDNEQWV